MDPTIKIMPCLDMQNGRVVKGVRFVDISDAGDPVACAMAYCGAGADELAMLDITATVENRATMLDVVKRVAAVTTIPFTVGGGISNVNSAAAVLAAGADRVSTSSAVFRRPELIREMVQEFGADKVTVAIDVAQNRSMPSGYEVWVDGGRTATGRDAIEWAKEIDGFGVKTILPTSKSTDGMKTGYDLPLIRQIRTATRAEVVASGGAGKLEHFLDAAQAGATILLAASVFHFNVIGIKALKDYLKAHGVGTYMRTTILSALMLGAAVFTAGCSTTAPLTQPTKPGQRAPQPSLVKPPPASVIGVPVKTLLDAAARDSLRIAFFTHEGEPSDAMPTAGGSVSIFNATQSGQDNYTFDADGRVLKQMRSVGANYTEGVWVQVP